MKYFTLKAQVLWGKNGFLNLVSK